MSRLFILIIAVAFVSCRCSIDFDTVLPASKVFDTTIVANAKMWQGQYEYLGITIKINRKDSLFVKGIIVKPYLSKGDFYPSFDHFTMYSYYYGNEDYGGYKGQLSNGYYWQDYLGKTFDKLPSKNRKTNKGNSVVSYTLHYNSEKSIDFENFYAKIDVLLEDGKGKTIIHSTHLEFRGQKDCRFSAH